MSRPSDLKSHNRACMPQTAALVDELREHFPGLAVEYAQEGEYEMGIRRRVRSLGISKKSGAEIVTCVGETNLGSRAIRGNTADRAKAACEADKGRGEA